MNLGKVEPEYQVVKTGSELVIKCFSGTTAKWYKNGIQLHATFIHNVLRISLVTHFNSGEYVCQGYKDGNRKVPFEAVSTALVAG